MKKIFFYLFLALLFLLELWGLQAIAYEFDETLDSDFLILQSEVTGEVTLTGEFLDQDILKISVQANDMQAPILGFSFHLLYQKGNVAFLRYEPGEFLERGGDPFYLVTNNELNGEVVFGETLRRNDSFPIGNGLITTFYFQIIEGNIFEFDFKNGIVSTLDTLRQDLDQISFKDAVFDINNPEQISDYSESLNLLDEKTLVAADTTSISNKSIALVGILSSFFVCLIIILLIRRKIKKHIDIICR